MKAILKTNTIITQKNKKPCVRTYLSIMDAGGLSFHIYYNTKKAYESDQTTEALNIHN